MKAEIFKKILAALLCAAFIFSAAPAAFAADEQEPAAPQTEEQGTTPTAAEIANSLLDKLLDLIDKDEEDKEDEETPVNPDDTGSVEDIRVNPVAKDAVGVIVKTFVKAVVETFVRYARAIIAYLGTIEWNA